MIADIQASDEIDAAAAHRLDRLLGLCAAQLEHARAEGEGRVAALVEEFSALAVGLRAIDARVDAGALEASIGRAIVHLRPGPGAVLTTLCPGQAFVFTRRDFDYLRGLVTEHTGIRLSEHKYDMFYARLARRVRKIGLTDFAEYVDLIRDGHPQEIEELINAITTGLTSFFREPHHFTFLAERFVPALREQPTHGGTIRIWSAGCSSGEEPYSIAITLLETLHTNDAWRPRILATDLDTRALDQASAGIYPFEAVQDLAPARLRRWFLRGRGRCEGEVRLRDEPRALVSFRRRNLMQDWGLRGELDAIFCRNVMIYFDRGTKERLLSGFHRVLRPDGLLFIGHSESLVGYSERFVAVGRSIYRAR